MNPWNDRHHSADQADEARDREQSYRLPCPPPRRERPLTPEEVSAILLLGLRPSRRRDG
jgi:hypothetical protein